jgi:DNA-binding NarL/FixJ family response regulator
MTPTPLSHPFSNAEICGQRASLLVVEAEPLMRYILRDFLQRSLPGLDILEAGNATRALHLLGSHRPRILLLDLRLHDTDVIAFTRLVRARYPDTATVILSAFHGEADVRAAKEAGAADYVTKDHLFTDLIRAVNHALCRHEDLRRAGSSETAPNPPTASP